MPYCKKREEKTRQNTFISVLKYPNIYIKPRQATRTSATNH